MNDRRLVPDIDPGEPLFGGLPAGKVEPKVFGLPDPPWFLLPLLYVGPQEVLSFIGVEDACVLAAMLAESVCRHFGHPGKALRLRVEAPGKTYDPDIPAEGRFPGHAAAYVDGTLIDLSSGQFHPRFPVSVAAKTDLPVTLAVNGLEVGYEDRGELGFLNRQWRRKHPLIPRVVERIHQTVSESKS